MPIYPGTAGSTDSPLREPGHLPNSPKAGWKWGASLGAAAFPGRAGMCSQGSCPVLPPSFFIHENSISLGAGQPEASSEVRCAVAPPLLKTCPHASGKETAALGPFPTSGVQGRWPQSECVRTPAGIPMGRPHHSARAGMGRTGVPSHAPRRCQSAPKAQISHPLDVMCFHHCSRLGPAMPRITSQVDHRDSGQGCTGRDPTQPEVLTAWSLKPSADNC